MSSEYHNLVCQLWGMTSLILIAILAPELKLTVLLTALFALILVNISRIINEYKEIRL